MAVRNEPESKGFTAHSPHRVSIHPDVTIRGLEPEWAGRPAYRDRPPADWNFARIRFPDIPERTPDDITTARVIHLNGNYRALKVHFSDRPDTIIDAEHYISRIPTLNR